jgi:CRISPR-associated protein Csm2
MAKILGVEIDLHTPNKNLFSDSAKSLAETFDETGATVDKRGGSRKDKNTRTQLRGFYDEIVTWNDKIGVNEEKYKLNEPVIRMFLAKVAYSLGRGHISNEVNEFMNDCFRQIDSAASLNNFRLLFEAIMGYYVTYRSK